MLSLPSGLMPADTNIEIFADPKNFGKCYWMSEGKTRLFCELPHNIIDDLLEELMADRKAIAGMMLMGISATGAMLEMYNHCNRGRLDGVPDITTSGKKTKEYFECGQKGKCRGEGKVCSPLTINGERITFRELECLKLIGTGLTYKQITIEMGFRRETAVNSLIGRLRDKLQCGNNVEIALKVKELGIV